MIVKCTFDSNGDCAWSSLGNPRFDVQPSTKISSLRYSPRTQRVFITGTFLFVATLQPDKTYQNITNTKFAACFDEKAKKWQPIPGTSLLADDSTVFSIAALADGYPRYGRFRFFSALLILMGIGLAATVLGAAIIFFYHRHKYNNRARYTAVSQNETDNEVGEPLSSADQVNDDVLT